MRLVYTSRAIADLTEIADYLVSGSPIWAERVRTAILATLQIVIDPSHAGWLQTIDADRKIEGRLYPHRVCYLAAAEIVVLTIPQSTRRRAFGDARISVAAQRGSVSSTCVPCVTSPATLMWQPDPLSRFGRP